MRRPKACMPSMVMNTADWQSLHCRHQSLMQSMPSPPAEPKVAQLAMEAAHAAAHALQQHVGGLEVCARRKGVGSSWLNISDNWSCKLMARHCVASRGMAQHSMARHCVVASGMAWHGMAWHGTWHSSPPIIHHPSCPPTSVHDAQGVEVRHAAGHVQQAQQHRHLGREMMGG